MTEFVVSVAFVFLIIFVFIPTFGKLMDIQFNNQLAARYVAWERTVWFPDDYTNDRSWDDFTVSANEFESVAARSDQAITNSMGNRFFNGQGLSTLRYITEDDTGTASGDIRPMWDYVQSEKSMYGGTTVMNGTDLETGRNRSLEGQRTPSVAYDVWGFIDSGLATITGPINGLLNAVGGSNDDFLQIPAANSENYYSPVIQTRLNIGNAHGAGVETWDRDASGSMGSGIESAIFKNWNGVFESRAAILADAWNAQSVAYYEERANDFVPTTVFNNNLMDAVIAAASLFEGGPANSAIDKLEFGAVGVEPMPAAAGVPLNVTCDKGFCYYQ